MKLSVGYYEKGLVVNREGGSVKGLICTLVIIIFLGALPASADVRQGFCRLKERSALDKDIFTVTVGERIKGTCKFYIDEFFGKKIVNANITIENTSDADLFCYYYVAFFDEDGNLVGCAAQGIFGDDGLVAGGSVQLGGCLIPLPLGQHEKISSYKIAFYESDAPLGKIKK
ncbi:MAG: hypothetical protein JSW40_06685 [Candidatus Omnitrophota bacterium]|nr:MAG: hypothetical protein JSW40_06685 [Candidatus Omnitrophota bacterium]